MWMLINARSALIHNVSEWLCKQKGRAYCHRPQGVDISRANIVRELRSISGDDNIGKGAKKWLEFFLANEDVEREELLKFNRFANSIPRR